MKRLLVVIGLLLVALVLVACQQAKPTTEPMAATTTPTADLEARFAELERRILTLEDDLKATNERLSGVDSNLNVALESLKTLQSAMTATITPAATAVPTVKATPTLTATATVTQTVAATATTEPADPLTEALRCLGFNSPEELIEFFQMEGVDPNEITLVPDGKGGHEPCAVRIHREKDEEGNIPPFLMFNPTDKVFDGHRACPPHCGHQQKVPPGGPWTVEGVTIRPW